MEIEIKVGDKSVWLRGTDSAYEICEMKMMRPEKGAEPEPTLVPFKYYSTLIGAVTTLLDMKVRASDALTMEDLIQVIKNTRRELALTFDLNNL